MRIVHIVFCLLVLATPILAEETAPPRDKLAAIESLVGTWVGSFEGVDGAKLEGRCSVSWAPTKYAIVWTWDGLAQRDRQKRLTVTVAG